MLGRVDAVHDRAALFALPPQVRRAYAAHLIGLTGGAPQLLICLEHGSDRGTNGGPPFSVTGAEVAGLYGAAYRISLLEDAATEVFGSGRPAVNHVWHLARR
jgi:thiopurine S-methyltransferase